MERFSDRNSYKESQKPALVLHVEQLLSREESVPSTRQLGEQFGIKRARVNQLFRQFGLRRRVRPSQSSLSVEKPLVIVYVEQLLSTGEELPSSNELAVLFKKSSQYVNHLLREYGLSEKISALRRKEKEKYIGFQESSETAWFLGVLFGAGRLHHSDAIVITNGDINVLDFVQRRGSRILNKKGEEITPRVNKNPQIYFRTSDYARLLAPFTRKDKVNRIVTDYPWAIDPSLYLVDFMGGLFDGAGKIYFHNKKGRRTLEKLISFGTTIPSVASFYISLLNHLGIESPRLKRNSGGILTAVTFGNRKDLLFFTQKMIPVVISRRKRELLKVIIQENDMYES